MKIWLYADPHFHHEKVIKYCGRPVGFEDIIFAELSKIPTEDMLLCLGDVAIGREGEAHEKYIMPLKCRKVLVRGNHDNKSDTWYMDHGWDFVCKSFGGSYYGKSIVFTHIPIPAVKSYDYNIHGHFHNTSHRRLEPEIRSYLNEKHLLVSIEPGDLDFKPVLLQRFIQEYDHVRSYQCRRLSENTSRNLDSGGSTSQHSRSGESENRGQTNQRSSERRSDRATNPRWLPTHLFRGEVITSEKIDQETVIRKIGTHDPRRDSESLGYDA